MVPLPIVLLGCFLMNSVDLAFMPALEQARLIRDREISPLELVELYLERIERLNPQLGAFFTVTAEQAIADATAKTEQLATLSPDALPLFFGVPTAIKDLIPVKDVPCSYGVSIIKNRLATEDGGLVRRLRAAGFVLLGKTATSELGSTPYTEAKGFPPTRNPWNLDYTPGGSSGGAAAAVAAGLLPLAHGSDGGGSIRGPAFCCGLVGLKPSRGRVTHAPVGDRLAGLATDGPLSRTVADAAAFLDAMAGYELGDPYWLPPPDPSFLAATQTAPPSLRIAVCTDFPPVGKADAICEQAVLETVRRLEHLGHRVEPIALDFSKIEEPFATVWQAGVDVGVPWFLLGKLNRWLVLRSRFRSSGLFLRSLNTLQSLARALVVQLAPYDVLLMPVFLHPTIRIGEWSQLNAAQLYQKIVGWVAPCPPINATGQPAIALPVGVSPTELPLGVQLVGRPGNETTLIALGSQLETAYPWSDRRPAIAT